jgi:hypothetical protein
MFLTSRKTLRLQRHEFVKMELPWSYVEMHISHLDVCSTETHWLFLEDQNRDVEI